MDWQIGQIIARHRVQQKLTQEQLGELVGVSGQAVSKWENGGVPDTLLLPAIASALHITVDALFGAEKTARDMSEQDVMSLVYEFLLTRPQDFGYFPFLFRLLWSFQTACLGCTVLEPLEDVIEKNAGNPQITSQITNNGGTTYLSLVKGFPFFCAVQDAEEISEKLLTETAFDEFFSLLADPDGRKAVFFTQTSTDANQYTEQDMADVMGIAPEKFSQILPSLVKYGLLSEDSLMLGSKTVNVYRKWSNPEIRPLLMMAYQFIHARQCYYNFTCNRTKPYF